MEIFYIQANLKGPQWVFRDPGFPLIEAQDSGSESTLGTKFGIESIHARLDVRNNHRNYWIARKFRSG